jgi:hypothetical protein
MMQMFNMVPGVIKPEGRFSLQDHSISTEASSS